MLWIYGKDIAFFLKLEISAIRLRKRKETKNGTKILKMITKYKKNWTEHLIVLI